MVQQKTDHLLDALIAVILGEIFQYFRFSAKQQESGTREGH